jgi:hypothetical protein
MNDECKTSCFLFILHHSFFLLAFILSILSILLIPSFISHKKRALEPKSKRPQGLPADSF